MTKVLRIILPLVLAILVSLHNPLAWGEEPGERLLPIDQTKEDQSFAKFKTALLNAIRKKDISHITSILSDEVMYSFGQPEEKSPVAGFLKHFKLTNEKETDFWNKLRQALEMGCTKSEDSFTCPYVFSNWPDKYESYAYIAVTKSTASIQAEPRASTPKIKSVSYDILKLAEEQKSDGWYAIDLGKGKIGYLSKADGRSAMDYRAIFGKTAKGWTLKYFVAGD